MGGRLALESLAALPRNPHGLLLLKHIYGLSDEGVCERWVHDPCFQHFTGEEFFQHEFPHERSDLTHWRKRLGAKLEMLLAESLRVAHNSGALRTSDLKRVTVGDQGTEPPGEKARRTAATVLVHADVADHDGVFGQRLVDLGYGALRMNRRISASPNASP
jgi:IS5 family transposase